MAEVFFSVDVETDGPIPGPYSMLSLGCAAFDESGNQLGTFEINLETLPGAIPDPDTMNWWQSQPEAWTYCRKNLVDPKSAMYRFVSWVSEFSDKGTPVFVGYPAGFDFLFVYWYLMKFVGQSPFSFSALDVKSYVSALRKTPYRRSTKKYWPKRWFDNTPDHTHKALDDAIGQGIAFMNMRKENMGD